MTGQIIGDNTTAGFTGSAFNLTTPKQFEGGVHEVTLNSNQRLIEYGVLWLPTPANGTTGVRNLQIGLYDLDTDTLISGTATNVPYDTAALVAGGVAVHVKVTGLSINLTAHAGKRIGLGLAPSSAGTNSGFVVGIRTLSGSTRNNHSATASTLPTTFAVTGNTANSSWGVYAVTEDIPGATPSIGSINSGAGVRADSTGNVATSTGTWSGAVSAGTLGGKAVTVTDFNAGTGAITFTMPAYADGVAYPRPNGTHTAQFTDGTNSPTISGIQLNPPTGRTAVTVASPDNTSSKKLGQALALIGKTPVNGDVIIGVDADVTWRADTGGTAAGPLPITTPVIFWQQSSGITYFYDVTITELELVVEDATIDSVGPVRIGGTAAVTVSNFDTPVSSGLLDGVALVSASNTSITMQGLVNTQQAPRPGTRELSLTGGPETAATNVPVLAPPGYTVYVADSFTEAVNGVAVDVVPVSVADGDFFLYQASPAAGKTTEVDELGIVTNYVGTQTLWHISNSTKVARSFNVTTGGGAAEVGGGGTVEPVANAPMRTLTMRTL